MPKTFRDAASWDELYGTLKRELIADNRFSDPLQFIIHVLDVRERQRIRDKERELKRRARLAYLKEHPEKLPAHLR